MRTESAFRPLILAEREFLTWLMEHGTPAARGYIVQLEKARVRTSCSCGCPSLSFDVGLSTGSGGEFCEELAEFTGLADDISVGIRLVARGGVLSELEVYPFADAGRAFGLPQIFSLKPM